MTEGGKGNPIEEAVSAGTSVAVEITVTSLAGIILATLSAKAANNVMSIKERIAQQIGVPSRSQQLIWRTEKLANDSKLLDIDGLLCTAVGNLPQSIELQLVQQKVFFGWLAHSRSTVRVEEAKVTSVGQLFASAFSVDTYATGRHFFVVRQIAEEAKHETRNVRIGLCEDGDDLDKFEQGAIGGPTDFDYVTAFYYGGAESGRSAGLWRKGFGADGAGGVNIHEVVGRLPTATHQGVEISLVFDADAATLSVSIDGRDVGCISDLPGKVYRFAITMFTNGDVWEVVQYEQLA